MELRQSYWKTVFKHLRTLSVLWRSLTDGGATPALKLGFITPLHKGGDRSLARNYRPITLTSHVIKIFEMKIIKELVTYLYKYSTFNRDQHEFWEGLSYVYQLLEHCQKTTKALGRGVGADVIYLDFAKIFDKINHRVLFSKSTVKSLDPLH